MSRTEPNRNTIKVAKNAQRTSKATALRVLPKTGTKRSKVYEFILNRGLYGATDQEIQATLHMDGNTVRPSRGSLVDDQLVFDSGITRLNTNGEHCIVWRAMDDGMLL